MEDINFDDLKSKIQNASSQGLGRDFWSRFERVFVNKMGKGRVDGYKFEKWVESNKYGDRDGISAGEWNSIYNLFCK